MKFIIIYKRYTSPIPQSLSLKYGKITILSAGNRLSLILIPNTCFTCYKKLKLSMSLLFVTDNCNLSFLQKQYTKTNYSV